MRNLLPSTVRQESARSPRTIGQPHDALRPLLGGAYAGYTEVSEPLAGMVLPATVSVRFVVKIEDSALRPPQFVTGGHGSYMVIDGACAPSYVEIRLAPLGAYPLLGMPVDRLRGQLVDLTDVLGEDGRRLGAAVRDASGWDERFAQIDRFLLSRAAGGPEAAAEVAYAWRRVAETGGAIAIGSIAKDVGWSHKHLITRFRQQIGLTPRRAARLVRFDRVVRGLVGRPRPAWAQIAADAGYADQAHLSREFQEFAGTSPSQFVAMAARR